MLAVFDDAGDRIRYLRWRWIRNLPDALRYAWSPGRLDRQSADIVARLRTDGITATATPPDPALFDELRATALRVAGEVWDDKAKRPRENSYDRKGDRTTLGLQEQKDFLQVLTPRSFSADSVYLRYALQPQFMAIANSYLGLQARLRAIHLWLNYPVEGDATSTQLWHRDGDDFMNLKIFTYLTDVSDRHGPFTFIPGTQPLGGLRIRPKGSEHGRTSDEDMRSVVDESGWQICTGHAGSVIYADTCGYHKGMKPVTGYRLMLMIHYASDAAVSGSELRIENIRDAAFTREQMLACRHSGA